LHTPSAPVGSECCCSAQKHRREGPLHLLLIRIVFDTGRPFATPTPSCLLAEEDSVALATNRGADASRRVRLLRFKEEPTLSGRPFDRRARLDEIASEVLRFIDDRRTADLAAPLDVERHKGRYWGDGRYRRISQSVTVSQRIRKIVCIRNVETVDMHRGPRRIELHFNAIRVKRHRPKQAARKYCRSVVVNLGGGISLSNWTGENVQSYETKNSLMEVPVFCEEDTLHETHVGLKR